MLLWFVVLYWIISVAIGLLASLKVKNATDFAAAGHALPMYVVTATVFATWFGAEAVLGAPATFLQEGLAGVVADPFGSSMCLVLVGLFFAKPLYQAKYLTIGDFFKDKYGRTVEVLITLCIAATEQKTLIQLLKCWVSCLGRWLTRVWSRFRSCCSLRENV